MTRSLRDAGDGHNANDPAFEKLRAQLLEQYDVDDVSDLPVNFRGVVAQAAEADLSTVLNAFADERMTQEVAQTKVVHRFSLLSPALAAKLFSVLTASTDLRQHQRFLRDAEALRFDFVQQLNALHAHELTYADDTQRSVDAQAEQRTRVSAENWRLLKTFPWQPESVADRLYQALPHMLILLFWYICAGILGIAGAQRIFRNVDG